jgi:DNA-binding LytR/AlgR family response regulator
MSLRCLIVDDDVMARTAMQTLCSKIEDLQVVKVCDSAVEALAYLEEEPIDLIFLDIEMPEMTGIEFLGQLATSPYVVVTSSRIEYAFDAFEHQVIDYLKKPVALPRFQLAIEKVQEAEKAIQAYKSQTKDVYVKHDGRYVRINYDDILYFENIGDYVRIRAKSANYIIYSTLKSIDAKLQDPRFVKVHRTFIINIDQIKDIEENTLVISDAVIPISRAHRPGLMNRLNFL